MTYFQWDLVCDIDGENIAVTPAIIYRVLAIIFIGFLPNLSERGEKMAAPTACPIIIKVWANSDLAAPSQTRSH
jgi:hypothetical protein